MLGGVGVARRGVRVPPAATRASWATGQLPWPPPAYTERCPPQFDRLTLVGANVGVTATPVVLNGANLGLTAAHLLLHGACCYVCQLDRTGRRRTA